MHTGPKSRDSSDATVGLFYASQVLINDSTMDGEEQVRSSAKVYVNAVEGINMSKCLNMYDIP